MYEERIAIIQAIRNSIPNFEHYKDFTKRCLPFLQAVLPGYTVYLNVEESPLGYNRYELKVWGKGAAYGEIQKEDAVTYQNPVSLYWSSMQDSQPVKWQDGLRGALDRMDPTDSQERELQERELIPELEVLNKQVAILIRRARSLVRELPIPKSATLRNKDTYWKDASSKLRKEFPILFDTDIK